MRTSTSMPRPRTKPSSPLGPRILEAALPGLTSSNPTTDSSQSIFFLHLQVNPDKGNPCGVELLQSEDDRLKLARDISVASQIDDRSRLSPFCS